MKTNHSFNEFFGDNSTAMKKKKEKRIFLGCIDRDRVKGFERNDAYGVYHDAKSPEERRHSQKQHKKC